MEKYRRISDKTGVLSSISVTGYSGVTITCKYDEEYETNEKYFCKGKWSECEDQIRTEMKHHWIRSGRFSLFDDTTAAVFTVTIRNLRKQDSGIYHCGIKRFAFDHGTKVNLKVITEFGNQVNTNVGTVRRHSGESITIDYTYEEKHKSREKSVCKIGEYLCETLISISRPAEKKDSGRFSIHDDRSAGLLRVFIRELNVQDSGEYRIKVRHSEDYSFFSEFELVITDDAPKTTSSSPSSSLSSSSSPSSSSYISTLQTPLSTTVSERSIVTSQFNTITDSSLIIPLVLVLLLLIIAALLLLFLYKKHQTKAGGDSTSQTAHGNTEAVSNIGCDYKEIKDTHKQLPRSPSESSSTVYATAQLPTNPSDFCIYSNVQEASGDSQICISSAEDANYSVVNFHKKSDCPDSISLRNHQECCEYAAVNHHLTA
nr:CMRF35-like molecule 8 [Danio rerio]|eukprot:XP_017211425.2 CMRF35-like molecule 8 [Danio rerio]